MSEISKNFTGILSEVSNEQIKKAGYLYSATAQIISLENPYTKEYKIQFGDQVKTAFALNDEVYNRDDFVNVLVSNDSSYSNILILSKTQVSGSSAYSSGITIEDLYDIVSIVYEGAFEDFNINISEKLKDIENLSIGVEFDLSVAEALNYDSKYGFKLGLTYATANESELLIINQDDVSGNPFKAQESKQMKVFTNVPKTGLESIFLNSIETINGVSFSNLKIYLLEGNYEEAEDSYKILAPNGTIFSGDELEVNGKLRIEGAPVDTEVEYIWFKENPMIKSGKDAGYDERAGAGWELIYSSPSEETGS